MNAVLMFPFSDVIYILHSVYCGVFLFFCISHFETYNEKWGWGSSSSLLWCLFLNIRSQGGNQWLKRRDCGLSG